jgi:hypothetical protein
VRAMFDFLGIGLRRPEIELRGEKNRTPGDRRAGDDTPLLAEMRQILDRLPSETLEIFARPPYAAFPWSRLLLKGEPNPATPAAQPCA